MTDEQSLADINAVAGEIAKELNLPETLVQALYIRESNGNPFAIGDHGQALGLMQVHPGACRDVDVSWLDLQNAIFNRNRDTAVRLGLTAGCRYLQHLMVRFHDNIMLALMAYNQGPTVIGEAHEYFTEVRDTAYLLVGIKTAPPNVAEAG